MEKEAVCVEEKIDETKPEEQQKGDLKIEEKPEEVYYRGSLDYVLQCRRLPKEPARVTEVVPVVVEVSTAPLPEMEKGAKTEGGAVDVAAMQVQALQVQATETQAADDQVPEAEKFKQFMLDGETEEEMEARLLKKYAEDPTSMVQAEVEIALAAHAKREDPLAKNRYMQVSSEVVNEDAAASQKAWEEEKAALLKKRPKLMSEVELVSPQDQNRIVAGGAQATAKGKPKAKGRPKKVPEQVEEDEGEGEEEAERADGEETSGDELGENQPDDENTDDKEKEKVKDRKSKKPKNSRGSGAGTKKKGRGGKRPKAKAKGKAMKSSKEKEKVQQKKTSEKKRKQAEVDERKAKASRKSSAYHTAKRKALNEGASKEEAEVAAKKVGFCLIR